MWKLKYFGLDKSRCSHSKGMFLKIRCEMSEEICSVRERSQTKVKPAHQHVNTPSAG